MYVVFCMDTYYPSGGWNDYVGHADSVEGAIDLLEKRNRNTCFDFWQIVDTEAMAIVAKGNRNDIPKTGSEGE